MPKAPVVKTSKTAAGKPAHKFTIDYSRPANGGVFDAPAYEKFLTESIKVEGKTGQLADKVKIKREADNKLTVTSSIPLSKRYIKYLTKRFLKKNSMRDWIRVVASSKDNYELRFFNVTQDEATDEE
ncbi:ribosomal protein L22e [Exidia glandulosa HHB12029]|uniref:Ribosomal protein L22e n=1 Tax=Exidia glandulosa HHB12029 TaxID=1314781 RepID=A0A165F317_EXIGL|nr:ribosomal protein L22e [Exidia glandulosa HHB12029]